MDTINYARIWSTGSDAFLYGWKANQNPYRPGSPEYNAWNRGYQSAQDQAATRTNWRKLAKIKH